MQATIERQSPSPASQHSGPDPAGSPPPAPRSLLARLLALLRIVARFAYEFLTDPFPR